MTVRCFDASESGAIARWETLLGPEQSQIAPRQRPGRKIERVQLNPRNNRQFKALVSVGATELVTSALCPSLILATIDFTAINSRASTASQLMRVVKA